MTGEWLLGAAGVLGAVLGLLFIWAGHKEPAAVALFCGAACFGLLSLFAYLETRRNRR